MIEKSRVLFFTIIGVVVLAVGLLAFFAGQRTGPFNGEFEDVGLFLVKGKITRIESFEVSGNFKFLVEMEAETVEMLNGELVGNLPEPGDMVRFDSTDSRNNLLVDLNPNCQVTSVTVCEYVLADSESDGSEVMGSFVIMEKVGSTGLPEYVGTTK